MTESILAQQIIQVLIAVFTISYLIIYLIGIKRGEVKPVLATWLFFLFGTSLSLITNYKETGFQGLSANAFNLIDTLCVIIIFIVIIFRKETSKKFSKFEKGCLFGVFSIFIIWLMSGANVWAHLSIQSIFIVAYLPMFVRLWKTQNNTESLYMWSVNFVAAALGTIIPIQTLSFLSIVYGIRSTTSALAMVILILVLKHRKKKFS